MTISQFHPYRKDTHTVNIFYLDKDPVKCAQAHYDRHVIKMCLTTAQLLCTVQRFFLTSKEADARGLFRSTHTRHPCVEWASSSPMAYEWTYQLFVALLDEGKHRFETDHICEEFREKLKYPPPNLRPNHLGNKMSQPPIFLPKSWKLSHGMKPVEGKNAVSVVHTYRNFYVNGCKNVDHEYTHREPPNWVKDYLPKPDYTYGIAYEIPTLRRHDPFGRGR